MPVHDWTRVDAGLFYSFHLGWVAAIKKALNTGLLPEDYYALCEQHEGWHLFDVMNAIPPGQRNETVSPSSAYRGLRRTLTIRHVSGHRLIALLEILSPANKDRAASVEEFVDKAESALRVRVHLLLVDLFPPSRHDPQGMHGVIQQRLNAFEEPYQLPAAEPLTLASYAAGPRIEVYLEHVAVGGVLPDMPLFSRPDRYINLPLEATYQAAYRGFPAFWRDVLEGT